MGICLYVFIHCYRFFHFRQWYLLVGSPDKKMFIAKEGCLMKHIPLLVICLFLSTIVNCAENTQSSPAATASWWDRSKSYATSWVPQSMQYQAKTLSRSLNDTLNPMRRYRLNREAMLIAQEIWQLAETNNY